MSGLPDSDSGEAHLQDSLSHPGEASNPRAQEQETPEPGPGGDPIEWPQTLSAAHSPFSDGAIGDVSPDLPAEGLWGTSITTSSPYAAEPRRDMSRYLDGTSASEETPIPDQLAHPDWERRNTELSGYMNTSREPGDLAAEEAGEDDPNETPLFANYGHHPASLLPLRTPNFGHLVVFLLLVIGGYLSSGLVVLGALHFHLFGVSTLKQASNDIHYTLGSQAAWYVLTFGACAVIFPMLWNRRFLDGLGWRAASAIRLRWRLVSAAGVCFVLALVDGVLIPGPPDTPIDQVFRIPGAAWLLFAFGVTLAPFLEEIAFRGFLLPALCTAYDWTTERITGSLAPPLERDGGPRWSMRAMVVASILTSIPFALMHAEQTGYSIGPFLLLVCVSLVLCWVRLATRSLASSVLVHSCYNFLLFSLMMAGTGGFKHLDKM